MIYFTSDWHIGENRIGINNNLEKVFKNGDTLWHLGDVMYDMNCIDILKNLRNKFPKSIFNLIIGNYDEDNMDILNTIFDNSYTDNILEINNEKYYLNHYPINCKNEFEKGDVDFTITEHIHGLWKVQKNIINVGVDAWHFNSISKDQITFIKTACIKYYDVNVFPY